MPELPIRFTKGISRFKGAPLDSLYDLQNARITPVDEVVAFKHGTTQDYQYVPKAKPWLKFSNRWFDAPYMDDHFQYRNRAYLSKIVDKGGGDFKSWTTQVVEDSANINAIYDNIRFNALGLVGPFVYTNNAGFLSGVQNYALGTWDSAGNKGWDANDTGIQGITVGRAADYIFVPVDRYGQSGPWVQVTMFADFDPGSFTNVTGTDIITRIPNFQFLQLLDIFENLEGVETRYERVFIYKTIEYDINGETTDAASGAGSEPVFGGYYLEGVASDVNYQSLSYWPFGIADDTSAIADQLGPVIDRSRNHWRSVVADFKSQNVGAKAVHMDGGTAIYANVAVPVKQPKLSHYQQGADSTVTATFTTGPDTITRAAGSWITDGFAVGQNVWVQEAATATNNKKLTITTLTATVMTVSETLTAEGPTANVRVWNAPITTELYRYLQEDGTKIYNDRINELEIETRAIAHVVPWMGEDGMDVYVKFTGEVVDINSGTNQITLSGDWKTRGFLGEQFFENNDTFKINGTVSNDGNFTVESGGSGATAKDVFVTTGGTMTFDAAAGTLTRSIGSWITDGWTTGQRFDFSCLCENAGTYTVTGAVTASTITLVEPVLDLVVPNYTIYVSDVAASGGNTVIDVSETISVTETGVGTFEFWVLWERFRPDQNGRYKSAKQDAGKLYSFNSISTDYDFFDAGDFDSALTLAELPVGVETIRQKSQAYLSETNAPWTVTYDGFSIPDSSEILSILPSRAEEIEQITSYEFYVLTDNRVYVGVRDNRDVSLTVVESSTGVALGADGQALAIPVKGGIVFYGTDRNLYYVSGRRLTKISYQVLAGDDKLWDGIDDLGYDPEEDWLYVVSSDTVVADSDVYIYDFNLQRWMGAYDVFQPIPDYKTELRINDTLDPADAVNHQIGSSVVLPDDFTIVQADFDVYSEIASAIGIQLNILVDRVSPPSTDTIAVVEQAYDGAAWTVASGDILSGDVTVDNGDTIRVTINTTGTIIEGDIRLKIKGFTTNGTAPANNQLKRVAYDYDVFYPVFGYESVGGGDFNVFEEMDESGASLIDATVETQELKSAFVQEIQSIRFDYDGVEYSSTGDYTAGSTTLTNLNTGASFNTARDALATVKIDDAGHNQAGTDIDLVTFIDSISVNDATLVDAAANTNTGRTFTWRTSGDVTLKLLSNNYRDREIGRIRVRPNKPIYPHGVKNHRMRIKFEDFETLREILIFTENKLESD